MQFKHYTKDKKYNYDCASCDGKDHLCLLKKKSVTVKIKGRRDKRVKKENWPSAVAVWMAQRGNTNSEPFMALLYLNLCPVPLITTMSAELWTLYNVLDGFRNLRTPEDYYNLPALYVQAVHLISAELNRLQSYGNVSGQTST